jgi:hypothetical protein
LLFHHLYYYFLNANREIRMRTPLPLQGLLYVCVAAGGTALLWVFLRRLGMPFPLGVLCSIGVLSALSVLVIRVSTFGTAQLAEVDYRELDEDYYDEQTDPAKVSRFCAWYHRFRYERLGQLVSEHYRPGLRIADLGCGNCWWNTFAAPVTGTCAAASIIAPAAAISTISPGAASARPCGEKRVRAEAGVCREWAAALCGGRKGGGVRWGVVANGGCV